LNSLPLWTNWFFLVDLIFLCFHIRFVSFDSFSLYSQIKQSKHERELSLWLRWCEVGSQLIRVLKASILLLSYGQFIASHWAKLALSEEKWVFKNDPLPALPRLRQSLTKRFQRRWNAIIQQIIEKQYTTDYSNATTSSKSSTIIKEY